MPKLMKEGSLPLIMAVAAAGWMRAIPGTDGLIGFLNRHGGENLAAGSARYCYSVWLRHLVMAHRQGITMPPEVVAELGPGDSVGVGLAALISGATRYIGLDVVKYASLQRNIAVFDGLVELFEHREDIPDNDEFPTLEPRLESYHFPGHILNDHLLTRTLDKERIAVLRQNLTVPDDRKDNAIKYVVPWDDSGFISPESVDMIFSQSVLEHVEELKKTYDAQYIWLKRGGLISHSIDFKSHGLAREWNGHWQYSRVIWKILRGHRTYLINRQPYSVQIRQVASSGFKVINELKTIRSSMIKRKRLATEWRNLNEADLTCSGVFIQAQKI
jgi:hypothetical protein